MLNSDELFGRIRAELYAGEEKLGEVLFKGEKLRTFTPEGVYSAKLILGKIYAYANKEISVQSFAITKRSDIGKLARYDLDCAAGEIVVIDNYEMRSLAANLTEGLNERGKIANLTAFDENRRALPVYGVCLCWRSPCRSIKSMLLRLLLIRAATICALAESWSLKSRTPRRKNRAG